VQPTEAAWAQVSANLSRQPLKESALAYLEGATHMAKEAAKVFQAGARRREANTAAGKPATGLRDAFDIARARKGVGAILARLDAAIRSAAEAAHRTGAAIMVPPPAAQAVQRPRQGPRARM
jgi:hypothetical protein